MSTSGAVTMDVFIEYVQEQLMAQTYLLVNEDPEMHFYPIYSICHPSGTSRLVSKIIWGRDVICIPNWWMMLIPRLLNFRDDLTFKWLRNEELEALLVTSTSGSVVFFSLKFQSLTLIHHHLSKLSKNIFTVKWGNICGKKSLNINNKKSCLLSKFKTPNPISRCLDLADFLTGAD